MKLNPPPPRPSGLGPLALMSHVEQSVTCVHCQRVHNAGFIWNFSDKLRVCFTCYREMGEGGRKRYERDAAKDRSKKLVQHPTPSDAPCPRYTTRVLSVLLVLTAILCVGSHFYDKPLTGPIAEQRVRASEFRSPAYR